MIPFNNVIGGEFRIVSGKDTGSENKTIGSICIPEYSLGRTCIHIILDEIRDKYAFSAHLEGVLLPDYICSSVGRVIRKKGLDINTII